MIIKLLIINHDDFAKKLFILEIWLKFESSIKSRFGITQCPPIKPGNILGLFFKNLWISSEKVHISS